MAFDQHQKALDYCTYCPKLCRHSCPVSNALGRETLIPQAKMSILNWLGKDTREWQADWVEPLFACTGCRRCQTYCVHGNDVGAALHDGRAHAYELGLAPAPVKAFDEQLLAREGAALAALHQQIPAKYFAKEGSVAYLPSLTVIERFPTDITDLLHIFDLVGHSFVRIPSADHLCLGEGALATGNKIRATQQARLVAEVLSRFSTVVLDCPEGVNFLRFELPRLGVEFLTPVFHITEYLARYREKLPIRRRLTSAYYHDSCFLGRHLDQYDAPRELMNLCSDRVAEYFHNREAAECCGAAGLVPLTFPETPQKQAEILSREPLSFGVQDIVTASPNCAEMLRRHASQLKVWRLTALIAWATTQDH